MRSPLHILITGASGFVGQVLVRQALAKGYRITALVRDAAATPAGAVPLVHELGCGAPLSLPAGVDVVAHLAQSRAFRVFPGDAEESFRVNVAGAHEILAATARAKVSRACLVSSGAVYEPFKGRLAEDAPLAPEGLLGATKLAAEVISKPYAALFPISILRLFSPYGPGQTGRLVPDLINRVRQGKAVTLPLDGGGMRFSPSYVEDVCRAILTAIEESWSGVFNVAAPLALTIDEASQTIGAVLRKTPVFERKPSAAPVIVPELTRLTTRYELSQFRSFADGIKATIAGEH
jgi:nucleoside-diphosphate-sugar epimerase